MNAVIRIYLYQLKNAILYFNGNNVFSFLGSLLIIKDNINYVF